MSWCQKTNAFGRTVTVKIKYADFRQATRSRTHPAPIRDRATLDRISIALVRSIYPPAKGIRLLGVTLSGFAGSEGGLARQLDFALTGA